MIKPKLIITSKGILYPKKPKNQKWYGDMNGDINANNVKKANIRFNINATCNFIMQIQNLATKVISFFQIKWLKLIAKLML